MAPGRRPAGGGRRICTTTIQRIFVGRSRWKLGLYRRKLAISVGKRPMPSNRRKLAIQLIRDGLNLARATHDFAPHRDEFCLVHPKLSTQNSNAIKIKGSDVFQGGFNAINGRKCKDPPDSTDPNFHSTLVHSHLTSAPARRTRNPPPPARLTRTPDPASFSLSCWRWRRV